MYWYVLVHTSHIMNIVVDTRTYQYERVHTGMYTFCSSLISLFNPGFRGSHRDDAMQAPAPAYVSCQEGNDLGICALVEKTSNFLKEGLMLLIWKRQ